jgi:hypothetical protein
MWYGIWEGEIMTVKTHYQRDNDYSHEQHLCEFCEKQTDGRWWSQLEKGYRRLGDVVWHCRKHRSQGRKAAEERKK